MALSEDQKAMLKLVSQPDTSYEDIAALMGLSVDEVRAKVDAALAELDSAKAAPPEPTPPPAAKADPEPEAKQAPESKPEAKAPPKPVPEPRAASKPKTADRPRLKLPEDKGARYGLFAGGAVLVILILLLVTGALGGDQGSQSTSTTAQSGSNGTNTSNQPEPTQAKLTAVDGSDASGLALFGRSGKNVVLLVRAKGFSTAPSGQSYTVSLAKGAGERVPLIATEANDKGEIAGSFQIAPQILGLLASGYDEMEISLVPNQALSVALKAAQKEGKAPTYEGTDILRGEVTGPIVEVDAG